jgi:hypothetical protein
LIDAGYFMVYFTVMGIYWESGNKQDLTRLFKDFGEQNQVSYLKMQQLLMASFMK